MPRPPNPEVRKNLLAAGLDLVHARGFAASGVKDITDAAGVPKGSFYAYFPSKEAFGAAILEHYWDDIEKRLLPILDADGSAQERITRFFHALADEHEAGDFLLGCLVGNLSLELGGSSEPVRAELVSILDRWGGALAACVRSGQQGSGEIRGDLDAGARLPADRGMGRRGPPRQSDPQSRPIRPVRSGHRPGTSTLNRHGQECLACGSC